MHWNMLRNLSLTAFAATTSTVAQAQTFTGLGFLPGGTSSSAAAVSRDGSVVVGTAGTPQGNRAFRWTAPGGGGGGMVSLRTLPDGTYSGAAGVSDDGTVVVGTASMPLGVRAFRWTSAGMVDLGLPIDGGGDGEAYNSYGYGVSGDGLTVIGISDPVPVAFRYTSPGGMVSIGALGGSYSSAQDVSANGLVVVGDFSSSPGDLAFRWTPPGGGGGGGGMVSLGVLPGGSISHAFGCSADGSVVVGWSNIPGAVRAFRWTPPGPGGSGGMVSLGVLTGQTSSRAYGVSGNGAAVVGYSATSLSTRPTLWNAAIGTVDLNTYLPSLGANLTGWTITWVSAASYDGRTLVGYGTHNGATEAWIATVPPPPPPPCPCPADFNCSGAVQPADIAAFVATWSTSLANHTLDGDFDHNGVIQPADVAAFVTAWFAALANGC